VTAELHLRIAFWLQVKLREGWLEGKIQQLCGARIDVFEGKRLEEASDVAVYRGAWAEKAGELEAGTEGAEALREIG